MREDVLKKRKKISSLKVMRNKMHQKIKLLSEDYIKEFDESERLIDISDHAIVRYLQRKKNQELFGFNDTEKVANYLSENETDYDELIEKILPRDKQENAIEIGATVYKYKDLKYVIKNFTVVTIMSHDEKIQ